MNKVLDSDKTVEMVAESIKIYAKIHNALRVINGR